jgi:hypothetical protein
MSVVPPGGKGMINLIGLVGQAWAKEVLTSAIAKVARVSLSVFFMVGSLLIVQ